LGGGAEVGAFHGADDVGVPIDETHELLKTPNKEFRHLKNIKKRFSMLLTKTVFCFLGEL
jgi:hypothetical protein